VSVRFQGADRSFGPGELPPGTYRIMAVFTTGSTATDVGQVIVSAGETVVVNCATSFLKCRVR
jgi:hypothetical protein